MFDNTNPEDLELATAAKREVEDASVDAERNIRRSRKVPNEKIMEVIGLGHLERGYELLEYVLGKEQALEVLDTLRAKYAAVEEIDR